MDSSSQSAEVVYRRHFEHFGLGHLVLELKVSAAVRIQAVLFEFSTGPRNCCQAVVFTPTTLLTGTAQKLKLTAIAYICIV